MCEYKDEIPDPAKMHMLWGMWMRRSRETPPSPEEMAKYARDQAALAERVRKLEAADAKLRVQEQLEKKLGGSELPLLPLVA